MSYVAGYRLDENVKLIAPVKPPSIYHWKPCFHCATLSPYVCDRVILVARKVCAERVQPGDVIWRQKRPDRKAIVISAELITEGFLGEAFFGHHAALVKMVLRNKSGSKGVKTIAVVPTSSMVTFRPAPCKKVACEQCVREAAPNVHYCVDHWIEFDNPAYVVPVLGTTMAGHPDVPARSMVMA